ncbi:MAG: tetratricopeptide repeat protein [Flavobacteriales bacterium]|nr:tetratricopeptide repeat protein [Flavobacteriales bacterium]
MLRASAAPVFRSLVLAFGLVLSGCSTEKDAFLNRSFHRTTARFNGWFNANEKLNEAVANMEMSYQDDFDQVLPIFIYGTEQQAKSMSKTMDVSIDKCAVVIDRHSMEIKDKERNIWIANAYFVIGKAHFYKRSYYEAMRTFDYVGRRYKGHDLQMVARIWQARAAIELEQYGKANTVLDEVRNERVLPKKFPHDELSAVQAHLEIRRGKVDDAIVNLERAVSLSKNRKERVRWTFILGQLYQNKGKDQQAIDQFARVTRMSPPYEIGFHAQIFQALAFDRGNSKAIRQKLNRMLRDEKHVDHFDMLHYALAELDLKEGQKEDAIARLRTSCRVSTTDTRQKAKSFLRLADIFFDDRAYKPAQLYYDSTASILSPEHARYKEVNTRAEVLGELVEQLNIIAREDSLQRLASMDPDQRERIIRRMIRERAEQEEASTSRELEARETIATPANRKPTSPPPAAPTRASGISITRRPWRGALPTSGKNGAPAPWKMIGGARTRADRQPPTWPSRRSKSWMRRNRKARMARSPGATRRPT